MEIEIKELPQNVTEVVLKNSAETQVTLWSWGATLARLLTKDRRGQLDNIVLGVPLGISLNERHYLGVTVGPVAGRISKGEVSLWEQHFSLTANEGLNHLHGGIAAFDRQNWQVQATGKTESSCYVRFAYEQADKVNGYPGPLQVSVTYTLTEANELQIEYGGESASDTLLNPTNHSYFNLSGGMDETIAEHTLAIASDYYVPLDRENIPLGYKESLENSPLSLKVAQNLGVFLKQANSQLLQADGLNHAFELGTFKEKTILAHPKTGRKLTVTTTEPSVVIYTGNHFDGDLINSEGKSIVKHGGLAIETQRLPDCDNQTGFGSVFLKKGDTYYSKTVLTLGII